MENTRIYEAEKVTIIGFFVNLFLVIFKLLAGFIGKSSAMVADGIHSLSDFVTDVVVLAFIKISGKEKDSSHDYGHGKFETFATMIISVMLFGVGVYILISGASKIIDAINGEILPEPGLIALFAALVSVISKEILFRYTVREGKKINSYAVIANAWHHRTDALSSIGTAIGIGGAIFLGASWRVLDPIAGVVVSFFIIKIAFQLGLPSINELLESSLSASTEADIERIIRSVDDVKDLHNLRTRKVGPSIAIDVHVKMDSRISFVHSHEITKEIEKKLRETYGSQTFITIHTEPIIIR